ncbi:MAG: hypothetical protein MUC44_13690 [Beijerinckiaceae bacterium]|jgi:hypothetical protein|nr:hypothetical protein [Beijerinckiaceae bacterium]
MIKLRHSSLAMSVRGLFVAAFALVLVACAPEGDVNLASPATDPALAGSVVPAAFAAQSASVTPSQASTRREARARGNGHTHYIEFRARSANSYGHSFTSVGKLGRNGSIATSEIVGLHPATESPVPWMIGHVLPVPSETGASDGDTEEIYFTARFKVTMDEARYNEMMVKIRELQASSPTWHAIFYNCNAFVGDIAKFVGLTPPANSMLFPKEYIEELKALNRS